MAAIINSFNPVTIARQQSQDLFAESFQVNIHAGRDDTFTLETLCQSTTTISELKKHIMIERNLDDTNQIVLSYNDQDMDDIQTLGDYNIYDNRHLILMKTMVKSSDEPMPEPMYVSPPPPDYDDDQLPKYSDDKNNNNGKTLTIEMEKSGKKPDTKATADDEYKKKLDSFKKKEKKTFAAQAPNFDAKKLIGLCMFCFFITLLTTSIVAVIMGHTNKSECAEIKVNKQTSNSFLKTGGWVYIGTVIFIFVAMVCRIDAGGNAICFIYFFMIAWCIRGYKFWEQIDPHGNNGCQTDSTVIMVLSWSIINGIFVFGLAAMLVLAVLKEIFKKCCSC